jgi:hypothetical protein
LISGVRAGVLGRELEFLDLPLEEFERVCG